MTPNWYTLTTDVLREMIAKGKNEDGQFTNPFVATFVFMGVSTEAIDKDTAEESYRTGNNLVSSKEPACMLSARREFFLQYRKRLMI